MKLKALKTAPYANNNPSQPVYKLVEDKEIDVDAATAERMIKAKFAEPVDEKKSSKKDKKAS